MIKCLKDLVSFKKVQTVENIKIFLKTRWRDCKIWYFYVDNFGKNIYFKNGNRWKKKIVILASDLWENSTISSFYSKGTARIIDSKKKLQIVEKNSLLVILENFFVCCGNRIVTGKKSYTETKVLIL